MGVPLQTTDNILIWRQTLFGWLVPYAVIRDILMYIEFYALCLQYFPAYRTEIPEAWNKSIKKQMKLGLVDAISHIHALKNEKLEEFITYLFAGINYGVIGQTGRDLASEVDLSNLLFRNRFLTNSPELATNLMDLQYLTKQYAPQFRSV